MIDIIVKPIQKQKVKFEHLDIGDIFKFNNHYYMKIPSVKIPSGCYGDEDFNCMIILVENYMYFGNKNIWMTEDVEVEPIKSELIIYDDEGVMY